MQSQLYASTTAVRAPATLMRLGRRLQRAEAGRGGRDTEDHACHPSGYSDPVYIGKVIRQISAN